MGENSNWVQDAECAAQEVLTQISRAKTREEVKELTGEYVRVRYFLKPEDLALEHFNALGQMSIARSTGLDLTEVLAADLNVKCDAASSSLTKKILLMIALNRALQLELSPEESAEITTLSELADVISHVILGRNLSDRD